MMAPNMAGVPEGPDVGQAIHSDWGAIGLDAEIVEVEFAESCGSSVSGTWDAPSL